MSVTAKGGYATIEFLKPVTANPWTEVTICDTPEWLDPANGSKTGIVSFQASQLEAFRTVLVRVYSGVIKVNPTNQTLSNATLYGNVTYPLANA